MARQNLAKEAYEKRMSAEAKEATAATAVPPVQVMPQTAPVVLTPQAPISVPASAPQEPVSVAATVQTTTPVATPPIAAPTPAATSATFTDPFSFTQTPSAPEISARERELEAEAQRLERERNEFSTKLEKERAAREALELEMRQVREYRDRIEAEQLIQVNPEQFQSLAPETIQELTEHLLRPTISRMRSESLQREQALRDQMAADRETMNRALLSQAAESKAASLKSIDAKILEAVPNLKELQQTAAYREYMASPVSPNSTITNADVIGAEYRNGNTGYIVESLRRFQTGLPSVDAIASVAPSSVATQIDITQPTEEYDFDDLSKWNRQVRTGEISKEQFRQNMAAYKSAQH